MSTNDDENESDESLYYGELPIVRNDDEKKDFESQFEHLWISLETPISSSPLRPSGDLRVRISVGMIWRQYGQDVVTGEGLDPNLRFRKLHTRPNLYGVASNAKQPVLLSGMPSGWFTRVQIADDPETYERLKRLGWSNDEDEQQRQKVKTELTTKDQISTALRLLVNCGPDALKEKGETKIRECLEKWKVKRDDSNQIVSFLNSNTWNHVVIVRRIRESILFSLFSLSLSLSQRSHPHIARNHRYHVVNCGTRRLHETFSRDVVMTRKVSLKGKHDITFVLRSGTKRVRKIAIRTTVFVSCHPLWSVY